MILFGAILKLFIGFAFAAEKPCTIWHNPTTQITDAEKGVAASYGYNIKTLAIKDGGTLEQTANLLNDTNFIIKKIGRSARLVFSVTEGRYTLGWQPITMPFSIVNSKMLTSCSAMQPIVQFYRQLRGSILDIHSVLFRQTDEKQWGPMILTLEKNLLRDRNVEIKGDAFQVYQELLEKVKALNSGNPEKFFEDWLKVQELLYSNTQYDVNYCGQVTLMTHLLLEQRCGNCQSETGLMAALFHDGGFVAPKNWVPAVQVFGNHIQTVIYNSGRRKTFALQSTTLDPATAMILPLEYVLLFKVRPQRRMMFSEDMAAFANYPVKPLFKSTSCLPFAWRGEFPLQLLDINNIVSCENYDGAAPDFSDSSKRLAKGISETSTSLSKEKSPFEQFFGGVGNFFGGFFEEKMDDQTKADLIWLAGNMSGDDSRLLLQAANDGRASDEFMERYSLKKLFYDLGHAEAADLFQTNYIPKAAFKAGDISEFIMLPPYIVSEKDQDFEETSSKHPLSKMDISYAGNRVIVYSYDEQIRTRLLAANTTERFEIIIQELQKQQKEALVEINSVNWGDSVNGNIGKVLTSLSIFALLDFNEATKNLQEIDGILVRPKFGRNVGWNWAPAGGLTLNLAFPEKAEMHKVSESFKKFVDQMALNVPAVLKKLDSADPVNNTFFITNLKQWATVSQDIEESLETNYYSVSDKTTGISVPLNTFVAAVLFDRDYFFTVEPEKEEILQLNPLPIKDLRVQEKVIAQGSNLPQVNLPKVVTHVCDGVKEYSVKFDKNSGFYVECPGDSVTPKVAQDGDDKSKSQGSSLGNLTSNDPTKKVGVLDYDLEGKGLSPIIPKSENTFSNSEFAQDPRQEVHLSIETWRLVLQLASTDVFNEPEIKVLLHHVYRKKLKPVYSEFFEIGMLFFPQDYSPQVLAIPDSELAKIKSQLGCEFSTVGCWSKILAQWKIWQDTDAVQSSIPWRFRRTDFLSVAYLELINSAKPGSYFAKNEATDDFVKFEDALVSGNFPTVNLPRTVPFFPVLYPDPNFPIFYINSEIQINSMVDHSIYSDDYSSIIDETKGFLTIAKTGSSVGEAVWSIHYIDTQKSSFTPPLEMAAEMIEKSFSDKYMDRLGPKDYFFYK